MPTDAKLAVHGRYLAGWNEHDPHLVVEQFAPSGTYVDANLDGPVRGDDLAEYVTDVTTAFPDLRLEQRRLIRAETDGLLVEEWTMHGTHRGPLDGLPPTGETLALEGMSVVTIAEDGITSFRGFFDQQSFAEQLGLTFPAVLGQLPTLAVGKVRQAVKRNRQ